MAASSVQSVAIFRFLLPQLTWAKGSFRHAAPAGVLAFQRYQPSSSRPQHPSFTRPGLTTALPQSLRGSLQASHARSVAINPYLPSFRRSFSATARIARDHHFDTLKFVQRLKDEGFTEEQAEAMMRVLSDVIEER
jgi:hypothetical protein